MFLSIYFFGTLSVLHSANAQTLNFQSYTTRDGLQSNLVSAICQDSRGYLWIGTKSGLTRYDGAEMVSYSVVHGLPNNWVTAIAERPEDPGTLVIGTIAGGLCEYRNGGFRELTHAGNVNHVYVDRTGAIWFIMNDTLFLLQHDSLRVLAIASVYPERGGIIELSDSLGRHRLAVGLGTNLLFFTPDAKLLSSVSIPRFGDIYSLTESASDKTLWITSIEGKLAHVSRSGEMIQVYDIPQEEPSTLACDREGGVWLRTVDGVRAIPTNLRQFNSLAKPFTIPDFRPGHWVGPIFFDREDNMWAGTWARGLLKVSDRRIIHYPIEGILGGIADSTGNFWLATDSSIIRVTHGDEWSRQEMAHLSRSQGRWEGAPAIDEHRRLWISHILAQKSEYVGLQVAEIRERTAQLVPVAKVPLTLPAAAWFVDREGRCWVPMGDSAIDLIDVLSLKHLRTLRSADGLPRGGAKVFFQDHTGNVWIGLWHSGLVRCSFVPNGATDGQFHFRLFTSQDGLPQEGIRALHEDANGNLWIGTRYGGLARLDTHGVITSVSMMNGLRSNSVWKIATDGLGRVWLLTDAGIECIESSSLKPLTIQYKLNELRPYTIGVHRDQFLWLVTPDGISVFEFGRPMQSPLPPLVHINTFQVNNVSRTLDGGGSFLYNENSCTIGFTGLGFADERHLQYSYRLLGLDSSWSVPVNHRTITYAALDPGAYTFEVVALTSENEVSQEPARLRFQIMPPFYQRWWFSTVAVILFGTVLWLAYRYRVKHLLELERLRMRIASDLHDDVGTNLGSIIITSQLLERQAAATLTGTNREHIREISEIAQRTQEMMRDIVWMLNPANDHVEDLMLKMKEVALRLMPDRQCEFRVFADKLPSRTSIDFKRNVVLVLKETLHNVIRHSGATRVVIEVRSENNSFELQIKDNGKGFDDHLVKRGNGLANMQRRASQLGGSITLQSSPGNGTTVSLNIQNHVNT